MIVFRRSNNALRERRRSARQARRAGPWRREKIGERPTGGGATLKVGADDTAGVTSIYESLRPAGDLGGPPLHRHAVDEAFYVLEGEYAFNVEGRTIAAPVGSFLYVPAGTTHTFRHAGDGTGRMLTICHPGGIEEIFEASGPEAGEAVAKKYRIEYLAPPLEADSS
jgi:mannose-6-phosphate isomerase-like protein (cupin superfamily)